MPLTVHIDISYLHVYLPLNYVFSFVCIWVLLSLFEGHSGVESNGYRPLTSLGLYRGPQQQSILQLGAHALGHDSGQVCPRGVGMGAGGAGGG